MAHEGHVVEVSAKELHDLTDAAEASIDALESATEKAEKRAAEFMAALEGDAEAKDEEGNPTNPGIRAQITTLFKEQAELADGYKRTIELLEEEKKTLIELDKRTKGGDKTWADPTEHGTGHYDRTKVYRSFGKVMEDSLDAYLKHGYREKVDGYVRATDQDDTQGTLGGILVPNPTWEGIVWIQRAQSLLRAHATQVNMPGEDMKVPSIPAVPEMQVQGNRGTSTTNMVVNFDDGQVMSSKTFLGINIIPNQYLQSAIKVWSPLWARIFMASMAAAENKGFLFDNPANPNGAFLGAVQEVIAQTDPTLQHILTTGASAADATRDDIIDMKTAMPDGAAEGSVFYMNKVEAGNLFKLKDANGHPIWDSEWKNLGGPDPFPSSVGPKPTSLTNERLYTCAALPADTTVGVAGADTRTIAVYMNPTYTYWAELAPYAVEFSPDAGHDDYTTHMRVVERIAVKTVSTDPVVILQRSV